MQKEKEDISLKVILMLCLIISIIPLSYVYFFKVPRIQDVPLNTETQIYAGLGEVCVTPIIEINCQEGLVCMDLSNKPYVNGVCLPEGYVLPEDFTNRKDTPGQITNETLVINWKGDVHTITIE